MKPFMKPLLATNYDESKLVFPLIAQPKIDGVRGLTIQERLVGRSLKTHANLFVTKLFSQPAYNWLDGELTTFDITSPACCRITTGDINRIGACLTLCGTYSTTSALSASNCHTSSGSQL
jgi:hypothetical protein